MATGKFNREWRRARANLRYIKFDVRVGKEMLLDNNGQIDVDGKAENFAKCHVLRSRGYTLQQKTSADDLYWVSVRVIRVG